MSSTFVDRDDRSLARVLVGDGRPLLGLGAAGLGLAGAFAFFVSARGELLPHDVAHLGMSADALRTVADGALVDFMFHDRVAFGGTLIAVAVLYGWLIAVPLTAREAWAWWLLAVSSLLGFASFLGWIGFGYLDSWHAAATMALLPLFTGGLWATRRLRAGGPRSLIAAGAKPTIASPAWFGRALLLVTGFGMVVAGLTILTIGSFVVFVPQDLDFIGLDREALDAINPRLVPVIAHDRSGFGGGLATAGLVVLGCVWCGRPSRALWQALLVAGGVGFGAAIGIHGLVGYVDASHVGPAVLGAAVFGAGMVLSRRAQLAARGRALSPGDGFAAAAAEPGSPRDSSVADGRRGASRRSGR